MGSIAVQHKVALIQVGRLSFRCFASSSLAPKLLDAVKLKPGDVVLQNEADGETGRAVIQLAKERGLRTVSVIGDKPGTAAIVEELKQLGSDVVLTEAYTNTWFVKRLLNDLPKPALALNSSTGSQATAVAKLLGEGGTLVTYGKELPTHVIYPGSVRRPLKWGELLEAKKIKARTL